MGYYLEVPSDNNKADQLELLYGAKYGAKIVSQTEAQKTISNPQLAVICVVANPYWEAAGFAFDLAEFQTFTSPTDHRPKKFLVMDRTIVKQLTNYPGD